MLTLNSSCATVQLQAFVAVDTQLHKIGAQRLSDALRGVRAEPILAGKAVWFSVVPIKDDGYEFIEPGLAVFNSRGMVRRDISTLVLHDALSGRNDVSGLVRQTLPLDEDVERFLEAAAHPVDFAALAAAQAHLGTLAVQ